MMGRTDRQITFSDYWLQGKIKEDSYWHKIRKWALENLDEDIFKPMYSNCGRSSVPPIYTFLGFLVQLEKGYSDREFEEASMFDDRVKYAITAPRDFNGIDAVTLHDHRARMFNSDTGIKIFIQVLDKMEKEGMFSKENLHVIDSFMVWGASARQDTYTMIYQGIKMLLRLNKLGNISTEGVVFNRNDYDKDQRKPEVNWDDEKDKEMQLDGLVRDAISLVTYIRKMTKGEDTDLLAACNLLERIATQDVEKDKNGVYKIVKGTAKDRIISVHDPEMRHGHKTSSKIQDGYKAEIITGGIKGEVVLGVIVDSANVVDGTHMPDLIDKIEANGFHIDKLYGDTAYSNFEEIEKKQKTGMEFCVKVRGAVSKNGLFSKEDFKIDLENGTVTCPNNQMVEFDKERIKNREKTIISFNNACTECPLRAQCTNAKKGSRQVTIHPYEDKLQQQREYQKTQEFKDDYSKRSNGERAISNITRHGGREARYIGKKKTEWQLIMVGLNHNVKKFMGHILAKVKEKSKGQLCPNMS